MNDIDYLALMGKIIEGSYKTHPDLTWDERVQHARDEIEFGPEKEAESNGSE